MEARKKDRYEVRPEGTFDTEEKAYVEGESEEAMLYIWLSQKIPATESNDLDLWHLHTLLDDIHNAFDDESDYTPLSSKEKKQLTPLNREFFPSQKAGLFSCLKQVDYKSERQQFIRAVLGHEFEQIKLINSRYQTVKKLNNAKASNVLR